MKEEDGSDGRGQKKRMRVVFKNLTVVGEGGMSPGG